MREQIQNARKRLYDLVGGEGSIWNTEINKENLARIGRTARNLAPIVRYPLTYGISVGFVGILVGGLIDGARISNAMAAGSPLPEEFLGTCAGIGLGIILGGSSGLTIGIYESVHRFRS